MNKLYVGIDVSSRTNVVYLMKPDGSKHSNFSVANSLDGSRQLVKRVVAALNQESLTDVVIGLESTGCYGEHLIYFLKKIFLFQSSTRKFLFSIQSKLRSSRTLTTNCLKIRL